MNFARLWIALFRHKHGFIFLLSPASIKAQRLFRSAFGLLLLTLLTSAPALAQAITARIQVASLAPPRVKIEGARSVGLKVWSFRDSYAGAQGLGERVGNFTLADADGRPIPVRKVALGRYESAVEATRFSYEIKLDPPNDTSAVAHVSWLAGEYGLLMPGDLLPSASTSAKLTFVLPDAWRVSSVETQSPAGEFNVVDAESSVFLVGRVLRERRARINSMNAFFTMTGDWAFTDEDAASAITDILQEHAKVMGDVPRARTMTMLLPFPRPVSAQRWSAETRGGTVVLLLGRLPSKAAALAHLNVPLAHELLHLWVPNALALEGDYDWFYEGFTLYQSVRIGMTLGHLTFHDYLNAMGRAFDGYRSARAETEISLTEASRRRWSGNGALVYNKGMLVAFLYDLKLRRETEGKRSMDDVYKELFRRHRIGRDKAEGNRAVASVLSSMSGMEEFVRLHVESPTPIDLAQAVAAFGLKVEPVGARTRVVVADSLSRSQRDLLKKLGYNERPK